MSGLQDVEPKGRPLPIGAKELGVLRGSTSMRGMEMAPRIIMKNIYNVI